MDGLPDNSKLISRFQKKLDKLEKVCMDRYQTREQRIVSTINFCMSILEQLQSWAVFAIFPTDEQYSRSYVKFVRRRFTCVMQPMRRFSISTGNDSEQDCPSSTFSPRDGDVTTLSSNTPRSFNNQSPPDEVTPLRNKIRKLAESYMEEAKTIKQTVELHVKKCRKDIRVIYRWCQASLLDLGDVIDDAMADELYFMVRGKFARSISSLSVLEEAADIAERTLTHHFGEKARARESPADDSAEEESLLLDAPWAGSPISGRSVSTDSGAGTLGTATGTFGSSLPGELHIGHLLSDTGETEQPPDSHTSRSSPGPPRSPRPQGLVNHPRIVKDRMQHLGLHSTW